MPACAAVNASMQILSNVAYESSEQLKDITKSRQSKDTEDIKLILDYISDRNPFTNDPPLRNISTGVIAEHNVNVDNADIVGQKIKDLMVGKPVDGIPFKRKDQAITMATKAAVRFKEDEVTIDPQLLFQRLIFVGERHEDPKSLFM